MSLRRAGLRAQLGWFLRHTLADRVDRAGAPKCMSSMTFTFELGEGLRVRDDGRGCRLWYLGDHEYDRAWSEADRPPPRIDWSTMTLRGEPS